MLTSRHPSTIQPPQLSPILLARLFGLARHLTEMLIVAFFTTACTVLMAALPLPQFLCSRWARPGGDLGVTAAVGAPSSAASSPTRHPCSIALRLGITPDTQSLARPHIRSSRNQTCESAPFPQNADTRQWGRVQAAVEEKVGRAIVFSRSHHRHYRRRCHHPFLFFQLHFSPSNLLFCITFALLLSFGSSASPSKDNGANSHLKASGQANVNHDRDITHYEARNASAPSGTTSSADSSPSVIDEYVCGDIDIRNSVSQFYKLENCTVVEGHVQIVLIDNGTAKDFANLTFPKLREITDYFLLFRIMGLQSLSKLFPNLSVIRGRSLVHNYALVIYEMLHLQDIGLISLTTIMRGDVRIEKNPNLCFVDTVDWTRIARNYLITGNKDPSACPNCNDSCSLVSARRNDGKIIGDSTNRVCWTGEVCQQYSCPSRCELANQTCSPTGDCCPQQCLGGCTSSRSSPGAPLEQTCLTCRNYIYKKRCYKECPSGTYVYFDRRCITKKQCYNLSNPDNEIYLKAFQNKCEPTCPVGYTENAKDRHQCDHCGGDCPKVCQSSVVLNVQGAQSLKGCTKINGSLEISISSGGDQIVKELEENLKDLTEITDYLKIARSFPLITLNFLRNLKVIHGNRLERQAYSLLVLDNSNLQDLWTLDNKQLRIVNGRPFVHINPKLCLSKINKMRQYIEFGAPQGDEWSENDVSRTTNGDKVPCEVALLGLSLWGIEAEVVGLSFENYKLKMEDHRTLLGYLIYYREAEHRNVSIFDGRDACSNNEWTVIEYDDVDGDPKNQTQHQHIIPNLKPFTQYALYIKTYTLDIATKGAQSQIIYFKTKPFTPSQPRNLFAKALKHNTIEIRWDLPSKPNGEIDHYNVRVTRDQLMVNHRDYCTESFVSKEHRVMPTPKPAMTEPIVNVWTNTTSSANDSFPWRNKDNKQCCTCKNEKIRPSDVEQSINFEDYIINTVYIKRTVVQMNNTEQEETEAETAAISKRRKRNISSETLFETTTEPSFIFTTEMFTENSTFAPNGSISSSSTTMNTLETTTAAPVAPEKFVKLVRNFLRRSTFGDLYHFTEYTIEVQACQQETVNPNSNPCSMTAITSVRTLPLEGADDINQRTIAFAFDNSTMESKFKLIHIRWDEPLKPNGFILSYYIEYKRITNDPSKQPYPVVCVSRSLYEQHNSGYFLELPSGNYSVRIRARSLADYGNWTEPVYIFVDEPIADSTIYIVTISIVASVILVFVFCAYKWYLKRVKLDYISVNPEYMSAGLVYHPDPKWEVPREHITLIRELGQGSFGMVYEGEMVNEKKEMMKCAVKTVNEGSSIRERVDFLKEADVMKSFTDCHHVVKLLGIVSKDTPVYVLMEIMPRGDLRKYLRDNRPENEENLESKPPSLAQLYKIAIEIADGMAYLASKKYVHRDLAARNCMVADDLTVKIGDFGMTRDIYETDYYRKGGKGLLPVRWMSPESLKDGIFTTYSDVWSYGIVLWEMATLASQPYQGLSNEEVLKFVVDGGRMSKPENCPEVLWNLMCKTWERKAKSRPTFLKIVEMLLEHIDEKPFLAVSYYSQWKNDKSSHQSPEAFVEEEEDGKDESLIPLKALSASADSDTDDSGSSSSAELGEEDINVKFFPLSRNVASEVKLFEEEAKEDEREPSPREDRAMTGASDGKKSVSLIRLHELTEKSAGPNGGEGAAKGTKLLPANSHLSTSLANNNSASHCSSASTSNVNLDANTNNKESVITSAVFAGFEDAKLNQPPKEAPLNAASGRNLINGHLINTSMV